MRRTILIMLTLLAAATAAQASVVEDATTIRYQHDAGGEGDASDTCVGAERELTLKADHLGLLVPVDDPADHYRLAVEEGETVNVSVSAASDPSARLQPVTGVPMVAVITPDCDDLIGAADAGGGEDAEAGTVTFTAAAGGAYVVRVTTTGGAGDSIGTPQACHPVCVGAVNEGAGYVVHVN